MAPFYLSGTGTTLALLDTMNPDTKNTGHIQQLHLRYARYVRKNSIKVCRLHQGDRYLLGLRGHIVSMGYIENLLVQSVLSRSCKS
jgi:hypothetical protein